MTGEQFFESVAQDKIQNSTFDILEKVRAEIPDAITRAASGKDATIMRATNDLKQEVVAVKAKLVELREIQRMLTTLEAEVANVPSKAVIEQITVRLESFASKFDLGRLRNIVDEKADAKEIHQSRREFAEVMQKMETNKKEFAYLHQEITNLRTENQSIWNQ